MARRQPLIGQIGLRPIRSTARPLHHHTWTAHTLTSRRLDPVMANRPFVANEAPTGPNSHLCRAPMRESAGVETPAGLRTTLVGLPGFEPRTSASRTQRATKLRHSPYSVVDPRAVRGTRRSYPTLVRSVPGSSGSGRSAVSSVSDEVRFTTTLAIRRLSISAIRSCQPTISWTSASAGMCPNA